jgi:translation initiation factor 2 subunit 1
MAEREPEIGISKKLAEAKTQFGKESSSLKTAKVTGILEIYCPQPNGVKKIKETFRKAKAKKTKDASIEFYVIEAPKYRIEVSAENYKRAQEVIQKTAQSVVKDIASAGGQGTFRRDK